MQMRLQKNTNNRQSIFALERAFASVYADITQLRQQLGPAIGGLIERLDKLEAACALLCEAANGKSLAKEELDALEEFCNTGSWTKVREGVEPPTITAQP